MSLATRACQPKPLRTKGEAINGFAPAEQGRRLVRTGGLEPPTSRLSGERSNRLSYARVEADNLTNVPDLARIRAKAQTDTSVGVEVRR